MLDDGIICAFNIATPWDAYPALGIEEGRDR
jgi:hypothetical protein